MLLVGLIYAWSIFVSPLEAEFGWNRTETSFIFSISMVFFCLGGLASGNLMRVFSTRFVFLLAAVFLFIGFGLSSRVHELWQIFLAYGVFCGFGVGITYNAVVGTMIPLFRRKGMVSGLMMFAFGLGGMILGTAVTRIILLQGWRTTFLGIAIADALFLTIAALFIRSQKMVMPEEIESDIVAIRDYSGMEMIKSKNFKVYLTWMICHSITGLMLIAHASPMVLDFGMTATFAAFVVGLVSIANGSGRFLTGVFFDRNGFSRTMFTVCAGSSLGTILLIIYFGTGFLPILITGCVIIGLFYGSSSTLTINYVRTRFGSKNLALNFSIATCGIMVSSTVGPTLAGWIRTSTGSYFLVPIAMLGFAALMFVMAFVLRRRESFDDMSK
jgi:OFA family oxalate/formate antiporter-like MFS transporter